MRLQHANHVVRFDFKECSYPLAPSNICYKAAKSGWNITLTSKEQNRMHVSGFSFGCSQILAPPLPPVLCYGYHDVPLWSGDGAQWLMMIIFDSLSLDNVRIAGNGHNLVITIIL